MGDHYETLGLRPDASKRDIRNAYFRLAHRYHPDHHDQADAASRAAAAASFRKVKDAYEVLYDDGRRAEYDRTPSSNSESSSSDSESESESSSTTDGDSDSESPDGDSESESESSSSTDGDSDSESPSSTDWDANSWFESIRELSRGQHGTGGTYSNSSAYRNQKRQYSSASRSGGGDCATISSMAWGHGGGSPTPPTPRPPPLPRMMARGNLALGVLCRGGARRICNVLV